jgi:hypothetical protein
MEFGPANGTLTVRTGKGGAASKAGHNLRMEVGAWRATLDLDAGTASLSADPRSFRVVEGTGGVMPLGDDEKAAIPQTIDEDVLKGAPIEFHSRQMSVADGRIDIEGDLDLFGSQHPIAFELRLDDGHLAGSARVKHSDFGVKPYSALFGTLKVADEVAIEIDARSTDG